MLGTLAPVTRDRVAKAETIDFQKTTNSNLEYLIRIISCMNIKKTALSSIWSFILYNNPFDTSTLKHFQVKMTPFHFCSSVLFWPFWLELIRKKKESF